MSLALSSLVLCQSEKKEKMDMMIAWKLTEQLKLTNEQAEKFFPRFREYREEMNKIVNNEKSLHKEIKEKIERGDTISNSDLETLLDQLSEISLDKTNKRNSFLTSLEGHLNNVQRAKLIGFEHRLRKDIKDQLMRHKKGWKKKEHSPFKKNGKHFWN
jgi:F0F1-type ATP synthase alpha subunit